MTALIPHAAVVTTVVGAVMVRLGLSQRALQFRNARRTCPSCGRLIDRAVCESCTGGTR
jgi:recombinational DNA repair protein RecR